MFGAFYSGDFYFGKSIWGPDAPIRQNPDVDGIFIPIYNPSGEFTVIGVDTGTFLPNRTSISTIQAIDESPIGNFIPKFIPTEELKRLK